MAAMDALNGASKAVSEALSRSTAYAADNKAVTAIAGLGAVAGIAYWLNRRKSGYHSKPTSFELTGGSLAKDKVKDEVRLCGQGCS